MPESVRLAGSFVRRVAGLNVLWVLELDYLNRDIPNRSPSFTVKDWTSIDPCIVVSDSNIHYVVTVEYLDVRFEREIGTALHVGQQGNSRTATLSI